MKTSVVIIAFNEESNIADAIRSASWADEVLVVDSESTDRTRDIATEMGARVLVHKWLGFSKQKQYAIDRAENDRIFSLDADERISSELASEINGLSDEPVADGYRIPRLSFYLGRPIRHGGWYPDLQLRFFDRRKGEWSETAIHESFKMNAGASVSRLKGDIHHFSVKSLADHNHMIATRYAPLGARLMYDNGRTTSPTKAILSGLAAFVRGYVLKLGFLDGYRGFLIAYFAAHNNVLKHLLLFEKGRGGGGAKNTPE